MPSALNTSCNLIPKQYKWTGFITSPILQMNKLRHREVKLFSKITKLTYVPGGIQIQVWLMP